MIRRTFSRIIRMDFQILYGAYVRPLLEYANEVVYSGRTKDVTLVERVQRAATRIVAGLKSVDYEMRLAMLDLFPLEYRRLRGDLILTYALFEQSLANSLSTLVVLNSPSLSTRFWLHACGDPEAAAAGCAGGGTVLSYRAEIRMLDEFNGIIFQNLPNAPPSDLSSCWDEITNPLHNAWNFACGTAPPGALEHWISDRTVALRAFDLADWPVLLDTLVNQGMPGKFVTMTSYLYFLISGCVRVYGELCHIFRTQSGVPQGCPLSPFFFNFMIREIMKRTLEGLQIPGVQIACGENLVDVEYAGSIVLDFEEQEKAQVFLNELIKVTSAHPSSFTTLNNSKYVFKHQKPVYLSTFNVRTLKQAGQEVALPRTPDPLCIDLCCLSETRTQDTSTVIELTAPSHSSRFRLLTSGDAEAAAAGYAGDSFYDTLGALLQQAKSPDIVVVAGDTNARLLDKLLVACPNSEYCAEVLTRCDLESHLAYWCRGAVVACVNNKLGCPYLGLRADQPAHRWSCQFQTPAPRSSSNVGSDLTTSSPDVDPSSSKTCTVSREMSARPSFEKLPASQFASSLDPLDTKCGHTFCSSCLKNHLAVQALCPEDKQIINYLECQQSSNLVKRLLDKLLVACPNSEYCAEVLTRCDLESHLAYWCRGAVVACVNNKLGCPYLGLRADQPAHRWSCQFQTPAPRSSSNVGSDLTTSSPDVDPSSSKTCTVSREMSARPSFEKLPASQFASSLDPRPLPDGHITFIDIKLDGRSELGISLVGGCDTPLLCVIIQEIYLDGLAAQDGRLRPGDQILEVNGKELAQVTHLQACLILSSVSGVACRLTIYREQGFGVTQELSSPEMLSKVGEKQGEQVALVVSRITRPQTPDIIRAASGENVSKCVEFCELPDNQSRTNTLSTTAESGTLQSTSSKIASISAFSNLPLDVGSTLASGVCVCQERVVVLPKRPGESLGMSVAGGVASQRGDVPIYVTNLHPNGIAALSGRVFRGDILLAVNEIELLGLSHERAVEALKKARDSCVQVTLRLLKGPEDCLEERNFIPSWLFWLQLPRYCQIPRLVVLTRDPVLGLGFSIIGGNDSDPDGPPKGNATKDQRPSLPRPIVIKSIVPGSPCFRDGRLKQEGQQAALALTLDSLGIDVYCVSETRIQDASTVVEPTVASLSTRFRLCTSGDPEATETGCAGFGIILSHRAEGSLLYWIRVDSHPCAVSLETPVKKPNKRAVDRHLFVASTDAPIDRSSATIKDKFYDALGVSPLTTLCPCHQLPIARINYWLSFLKHFSGFR
ncbi:hypothetical protein T265_06233 [Opisthorchis viverrini]|uniref:PDZ/DHR/GLGF domain protein n=1 Tax=Opisthorchis viverrini TaxID=6198 RepID=A0A074ZGV3_OPIVI|nr:hypothetical protein T265_06233 [Opisthorchis viverrini]KER26511.1 hypothetical protein T265_06233 [Opisthorchis viverrini]